MIQDTLFEQFKVAAVDQAELEALLLMHFHHATGVNAKEIHYLRQGEKCALALSYDANGKVRSLNAGPGLRDQDLTEIKQKIDQLLIQTSGTSVGQTVLFAHQPVDGHLKYRDKFQIIPVPPEAPQLPIAVGDHPLLLQFTFPHSDDPHIGIIRRTRIAREIELLCAGLTHGIWKGSTHVAQYHWVNAPPQNKNIRRSEYCQGTYFFEGINYVPNTFTETNAISPIALTPSNDYYSSHGVVIGQNLDLPDNFENQLDCFFNAPLEVRERFLMASFWFQHAQLVASISKSASFTALMSAIEALMPKTTPNGYCDACNRPTSPGSTRRFKGFIEQFAPDQQASNADKSKLYALRSALSHGGSLLHSDRFGWSAGMTSKSVEEWENHDAMWRIVRVALTNWLGISSGEPL
jgi:hypothetical protein